MTKITPEVPTIHRIQILGYPGVQQAAVLGLSDLLHVASQLHAGNTTLAVSAMMSEDALQPREAVVEAVILPPSLGGPPQVDPDGPWAQWIRARHQEGTVLCSVCVGAFWLASLGILDGRPATTHWGLTDVFRARFPDVLLDTDRLFIDDGDVITAGGLMAWTDLGLHLIERYLGPATMRTTARHFLIDPGGREQRFYRVFTPITTHGDAPILAAQRWLRAHLAETISVTLLADRVGLTERTFIRRFQRATGHRTTAYLQQLRVDRARELLETTTLNLQEITWAVGYADPGALRKIFERFVGLSPGAYRRRFSPH